MPNFQYLFRYLRGSFNDDLRLWLKNNQDSMKEKLQVNIVVEVYNSSAHKLAPYLSTSITQ